MLTISVIFSYVQVATCIICFRIQEKFMVEHNYNGKKLLRKEDLLHGVFICEKVSNPFCIHVGEFMNVSTFVHKLRQW
jgi:hypothetical protein